MAARLVTREAIETNKILASSRIKVSFRNHYTCPITGISGIAGLISSYFHANNAVCIEGSEIGESRNATVEKALFFADICMHVRKSIGNNRYSDASIRVYLTSKKSDKLGEIHRLISAYVRRKFNGFETIDKVLLETITTSLPGALKRAPGAPFKPLTINHRQHDEIDLRS